MIMQVFQTLVTRWISRCLGDESSKDKRERTHRFLEEALELAQAAGSTQHEAHALVEYVFGREAGTPEQEVGGVLLTLAGFCSAHDLELHRCAAAEIARVNRPETIEKCRTKQADKKANRLASPLPGRSELRWTKSSTVDDAMLASLRDDVAKGVATHDCGEWVKDGACQLCDRQLTPDAYDPDPDWRLVKKGETAPEDGGWVETNHPAVVACMGSAPPCAAGGCQYERARASKAES